MTLLSLANRAVKLAKLCKCMVQADLTVENSSQSLPATTNILQNKITSPDNEIMANPTQPTPSVIVQPLPAASEVLYTAELQAYAIS